MILFILIILFFLLLITMELHQTIASLPNKDTNKKSFAIPELQ